MEIVSLLGAVQEVCKRTGLRAPTTAIGNTDENIIAILSYVAQAGNELVHSAEWPQLIKEYTFTLVASQDTYALPPDYATSVLDTQWDRTNHWPLIGPITPQEWQYRKSGISTVTPRRRYRFNGWDGFYQFFIHPEPDSSDAGATMAFEYMSTDWLRPRTPWVSGGTGVPAASSVDTYYYIYYPYTQNVQHYRYCYKAFTLGGANFGTTAPTHTSGGVSDGVSTWWTVGYDTPKYDTDDLLLPSELIIEGARWRFKREKGLPYDDIRKWCLEHIRTHIADSRGATTVGLAKRARGVPLITPWSVADSGYGS